MSGRRTYYRSWETTPQSDEEDEEESEEEVTLNTNLSKKIYELAKDVSNLETEKYRIVARKQREINRLEEEVSCLSSIGCEISLVSGIVPRAIPCLTRCCMDTAFAKWCLNTMTCSAVYCY